MKPRNPSDHVKPGGIIASRQLIPTAIQKKLRTAQTAPRGAGANVHDALRDVLYHLRVQHNFTREELARVMAASDSPAHRQDIPPEEIAGLIDGLFTDTFPDKVRAREAGRDYQPTTTTTTGPVPGSPEEWRKAAVDYVHQSGYVLRSPEDWAGISPVTVPADPAAMFHAAVDALHAKSETVSLVTACSPAGKPIANDRTMYPVGWRSVFHQDGAPAGKAGVWWRHNPVRLKGGSGKNGAVTDADISAPRYVLLESDCLDLTVQHRLLYALAQMGRIRLRCLVDSAGKSLHALVEVDPQRYQAEAEALLADLGGWYGFDRSNTNPSRMSRAPGFVRTIGRRDGSDGLQRLHYLQRSDAVIREDR